MTSQSKSRVFRVTGLSRAFSDGDLQAALQETLNDNFTDNEKSQIQTRITIVPSCYETDTQRVALVQFGGGVPQFLSELIANPLGDWQVEMGDNDINFDCHFLGFTQLYTPHTPDEEEPVADIIAIAGLDGHAYGSWQGGNLGRMWLRDFLQSDLPQCRTMTYGYNSKLSSHGVATILDYGRELMEEIKMIRNTIELQQRPLIFIAHSFGGIIMAHCLVRASRAMDEDHPAVTSLHRATYGMLLFGIPHKGLVMNDIRQMLGTDRQHPRELLLRQISRESDILAYQLADFKNLIHDRKVVSFYEMEQTRQLVFEQCEKWMLKGLTKDSIPLVEARLLYETSTAQFHRVYIVVDALDEITQDNRQQFLNVANCLITKPGTCRYKIFITSRDEADISHLLGSELNLQIQPADNADDIRKVIWTKIEDCVKQKTLLRGKVDSETKYYVREILSQRAQGLFLWVQLQFDELHHATTRKELIHLIEGSYVNLEQTYQKLWDRIESQKHLKKILARALLEFLTFSEQPITFECLKQIIGQKTHFEGLHPNDMDEHMFLDICHSMVVYDWELKTFYLVHNTAREYLMNHLDRPQAHTWIAKACLQELLNATSLIEIPSFGDDGTATTGKPVKFMLYAALHWHHHSRNCIRTSEYQELEQAFLQHDKAPRVWIKLLKSATREHGRNIKTFLCFQQAFPSTTDSLFLAACFFGLRDIFAVLHTDIKTTIRGPVCIPPVEKVRSCISWSSHFQAQDLSLFAPILRDPQVAGAICAAEQGHEIIFKELWQDLSVEESVSEINLRKFTGYCCQLLATAYKHIDILNYIDLEPSPNLSSIYLASPFAFLRGSLVGVSAFLGHADTLQYWEKKLSTHPEYFPNTDLVHAILRDDDSAATLLLDHTKVDINLATSSTNLGPSDDTPLNLAAKNGHHKIIKILVQYPGIDVNWQDSYGQTALMDVADSGPAVEALCHHKNINVNLRNSLGLTALEIFIRDNRADALAELMKHPDIDVNHRNHWNEVPLMTAVRLRRVEIVRVLLQATYIDVNACDESGSNALDIARRLDHEPLIRLLSQRKGNIMDDPQEMVEDMSTALLRHPIIWD